MHGWLGERDWGRGGGEIWGEVEVWGVLNGDISRGGGGGGVLG